jgi:hypothetical protein
VPLNAVMIDYPYTRYVVYGPCTVIDCIGNKVPTRFINRSLLRSPYWLNPGVLDAARMVFPPPVLQSRYCNDHGIGNAEYRVMADGTGRARLIVWF